MTQARKGRITLAFVEMRQLNVLHWLGQHVVGSQPVAAARHGALVVDTCQRRVAIVDSREAREALQAHFPADGGLQAFEGDQAYAFLLRGRWPPALTLAGIALLVAGVLWALRVRPEPIALEPY